MGFIILVLVLFWFMAMASGALQHKPHGHKVKLTKAQRAAFEELRKRCYPY